MTKEIIIAAYDKDISWISKLTPDTTISIYRKGDNKYHNEIIINPNVGR